MSGGSRPDSGSAPRNLALRERSQTVDSGLFRSEVLNEQQSQWLGTVLLAPGIPQAVAAAFAAVAAAGILALLFLAGYTRTVRVNGWLVPDAGLVQIYAPQAGTLVRSYVTEGAKVAKGSPLLLLSTELHSEALGDTREAIVGRLRSRRDSLLAEKERQNLLRIHKVAELSQRLGILKDTQEKLQRDFVLQRARLALARRLLARQQELFGLHLTPITRVEEAEESILQLAQGMQALGRQRAQLTQDRQGVEAELWDLPLKSQQQQAEIDRNAAALEQEIADTESRRQIVITAPEAGTVTAIQGEPGGFIGTNVPLLGIIPAGSKLVAQLFAPSSAIGFIRPGQRISLRYQAFPYQKFGHYQAAVTRVSGSAISPSELAPQLAGLTGLFRGNVPIYRIAAALASQTVRAYGEAIPLRPGMELEADILLERRKLIGWVFDPLFTITGRAGP